MRRRSLGAGLATAALLAGLAVAPAPTAGAAEASGLAAGDAAPAFALVGSDGKTYSLEELKGQGPVVIAWFPKAFTGG